MSTPPHSRPTPIPGRSSTLIEPQSATTERPRAINPIPHRSATLLECELVPTFYVTPIEEPPPVAVEPPPEETRRAAPYRPISRPSTATLTVFDDGSEDGETIRIRGDRFVIGRADGDLRLPHDSRVSSKHLEIARRAMAGGFRWILTDLQSTNGLFVRVRRALLVDGSEFLVGSGRYQFSIPTEVAAPPDVSARGQTLGWHGESTAVRSPSLVELVGPDEVNRIVLMRPEYWIGTDPRCPVCREDDPFCEPKHARLNRAPTGEWSVEHNRTLNGLWLRMNQVEVEGIVHFQVGEQRLRLRVQ